MMTSRRALLTSAAATAVSAALAACSRDAPPSLEATGTSTAQPVLDSERLTAVLERIQSGMDAADAQKKTELLNGYLTGPAARVRTEEYAVATATNDDTEIDHFTTDSQAGTVGLTTDFPRIALTLTEADETNVPYLLALTQGTARENFELWAWVRLFPGVEVPSTNTASVGSTQVDADADGLVATPQEVLNAYIDALNNPDGDNGKAFADEELRRYIAARRSLDVSAAGEVSVTASPGGDGFRGLRTTDNGAIVFTTLTFDVLYKRTVARSKYNVQEQVAAMLGENTDVVGTVTASHEAVVAFSIPVAASGSQAVTLGMVHVLTSVTRDDSQSPD